MGYLFSKQEVFLVASKSFFPATAQGCNPLRKQYIALMTKLNYSNG